MKFLEKDLEEIIYNNYKRLHERGLYLNSLPGNSFRVILRQVNLGVYGIADLINVEVFTIRDRSDKIPYENNFHRRVCITVIECKLNSLDVNAYMQAKRYVSAIRSFINSRFKDLHKTKIVYKTILIGKELCKKGDFVFALNDDSNCTTFEYEYDFDGIVFRIGNRGWMIGGREEQPCLMDDAYQIFKASLKKGE